MEGKLMSMVKVGQKGQIVIPKEMRDMMGIRSGDTLLILADKERGIAIPDKADIEKIYRNIMTHEGSFSA
ncbi:MAG: AbrB/MazE/SpoVT family DNA-binding domain-containing protein [Spirochaetia bacterium]|jgi:AbrB family looped-hinge helix DNA binding protein|nr:AbrB/MazE/SpoVT family DNA-binding domain-containing protein [Spirochaetia bacterium]MCE1207945.1 AbrB/MazE/SpoVT family DNA-binding domain-containing protein [Spirochaetia bacterium]HOI23424.1 AbrB/MazE/SpoVT family DNA-binding domain-containing protein [Spirochaetales bacterium]